MGHAFDPQVLLQLLLKPANALRLTNWLSDLRGAALKLGRMMSMDTGLVLLVELTAILGQMRDDARHMPPKQLQAVLQGNGVPSGMAGLPVLTCTRLRQPRSGRSIGR